MPGSGVSRGELGVVVEATRKWLVDEESKQIIEQIRRESQVMAELDRTVAVRGERQKIRLPGRTIDTVFYPAEHKNAPMVFAFHGGGFVFGGCALDDNLHYLLSKELATNLVSVGYRKGEKNRFPKAVNDAYDVAKHYIDDLKGDYDFDRSRVATFGSSAGANLAVTTSILAQRRKEFKVGMQILNYPFLDMATSVEDKGYPPTDQAVKARYFNEAYAKPEQWPDPLVSPIRAGGDDFDKTMRLIVTLADTDELRAEGQRYVDMVRELGLDVAERVATGQGHAYLEFAFHDSLNGYCPPLVRRAADDGSLYAERDATVEFIKEHWQRWIAG